MFHLYKSKYIIHESLFKGGIIPLNNSHSVIDSPELVSLVKPPTMIIKKTKINEVTNQ